MNNKRSFFAYTLVIICIFRFCSMGNASSTSTLAPTPTLWQYDSFDDQSVFDVDWMDPDYSTAIVGTLIKQELDKRYSSVGAGLMFNCGTPWIEFSYYLSSLDGTAYIWKGDIDTNYLAFGGYKYSYNTKSKEWTSECDDSEIEDELNCSGIPYLTVDTEQLIKALKERYPMPTAIPSPTPSPAQSSAPTPFGFDVSADVLAHMGDAMYQDALAWGTGTTLVDYDNFPIVPSDLARIHNSIGKMSTSLQISGRKAIWESDFEKLCTGEQRTIIADDCYGWNKSGNDIIFRKVNDHTYESVFFQDASDVTYVRQEREWRIDNYQYSFMVDFFEAKEAHGDRITEIRMRNINNNYELSWQINTQYPDHVMIDVRLYSDNKFYSFEYDLNSKTLVHFSYSE